MLFSHNLFTYYEVFFKDAALAARFNAFEMGELGVIFTGELFLSMGWDNRGLNMSG